MFFQHFIFRILSLRSWLFKKAILSKLLAYHNCDLNGCHEENGNLLESNIYTYKAYSEKIIFPKIR